ncbi:MAG TPA: hypothetical protein PK425_05550, partial [Syntrophales bacterium]|nr:hypothetical protein [Syntrophales bacterium]
RQTTNLDVGGSNPPGRAIKIDGLKTVPSLTHFCMQKNESTKRNVFPTFYGFVSKEGIRAHEEDHRHRQ